MIGRSVFVIRTVVHWQLESRIRHSRTIRFDCWAPDRTISFFSWYRTTWIGWSATKRQPFEFDFEALSFELLSFWSSNGNWSEISKAWATFGCHLRWQKKKKALRFSHWFSIEREEKVKEKALMAFLLRMFFVVFFFFFVGMRAMCASGSF
jgi:hypothetical protein